MGRECTKRMIIACEECYTEHGPMPFVYKNTFLQVCCHWCLKRPRLSGHLSQPPKCSCYKVRNQLSGSCSANTSRIQAMTEQLRRDKCTTTISESGLQEDAGVGSECTKCTIIDCDCSVRKAHQCYWCTARHFCMSLKNQGRLATVASHTDVVLSGMK